MFRERFASNTARALARAARGAGPALGAGARHARGAGRSADAAQRDDHGRPGRGEHRCASSPARSTCRSAGRRVRVPPPRWASTPTRCWPKLAHARANGGRVSVRYEIAGPRRPRHDRPAGSAQRGRPRDRARTAAHLERASSNDRDVRVRRAHRRRRARVLRRRRHEGRQSGEGLEYWAAAAPGRLRRHRAARDARRAGDRAGQRLRARRRLRDGAGLRHRRRRATRRASACPSRASAACRSTAA